MFKVEKDKPNGWCMIKTGRKFKHAFCFLNKSQAKEHVNVMNNLVLASNAIGYGSK